VFCLVINLVFAFWFVKRFQAASFGGEVGLAIANTLSACFNTVLLTYTLRRKLGRLGMASLRSTLLVLVSGAILAGIVALLASFLWEHQFGHATLARRIGAVFVPGALAGLLYWIVALWMGIPAARELTGLVAQKFRRGSKPAR
jgi:peptidoglycan biosynthesis protein MviN/MurJ (putative lipid II flippase)